ncbi:hypothetical protein V8D89_001643 [Ganoderma adspersum]
MHLRAQSTIDLVGMHVTPSFEGLTVGGTGGALLLGTFFSLVFYGLILHQTYTYIRWHPQDYMYIQVLVALSLILETLHTAFTVHFIYHGLVTNYSNPIALFKNVWSLNFLTLTGDLSQITAYSFFVRRLYFSMDSPFPSLVVLLSPAKYSVRKLQIYPCPNRKHSVWPFFRVVFLAVDVGFSLAMNILLFQSADLTRFLTVIIRHHQHYLVHGKFSAATIAHISLTGSLIYATYCGQRVQKERKGVVDWCKLYIINTASLLLATGLLVRRSPISIFDVIAWILAIALPSTIWWMGFRFVTIKLYMVTFLAVLNSRQLLTNGRIDIFSPTDSTPERNFISRAQRLAAAERYNAPQLPETAPTRIDINVATEIEEGDGDTQSRTSHSSVIIEDGKVLGMM